MIFTWVEALQTHIHVERDTFLCQTGAAHSFPTVVWPCDVFIPQMKFCLFTTRWRNTVIFLLWVKALSLLQTLDSEEFVIS